MPVTDSPEMRDAIRDLAEYLEHEGGALRESFKQAIMAHAREIFRKGQQSGAMRDRTSTTRRR